MRFLLLSDIHACDVDPASSSAPSYVSSFGASSSARLDPLSELEKLVGQENLSPDFILCAGDITNRSVPTSLSYAWSKLHNLANKCGAVLVSTVGNHDLDSRYQANRFDPRGFAMSLDPKLPTADRLKFLEFWAENFTLLQFPSCNILVLNTAAYHGGGKDVATELEHGRISDLTIAAMQRSLGAAAPAPVNLLLCHHHPIKGDLGDQELTGQTRGGERLVEILDKAADGWIIVHGHKHTPDLFYAHGGGNAPVILACASFSAQVNADAQNKNPNQVHLLICEPHCAQAAALASAGRVLSWTWQPGIGWRRAQGMQGLPYTSGFGYRGSAQALAQQVDDYLTRENLKYASWASTVVAVPLIERLVPNDFLQFERALKARKLTILVDRDGSIAQVGRSP